MPAMRRSWIVIQIPRKWEMRELCSSLRVYAAAMPEEVGGQNEERLVDLHLYVHKYTVGACAHYTIHGRETLEGQSYVCIQYPRLSLSIIETVAASISCGENNATLLYHIRSS